MLKSYEAVKSLCIVAWFIYAVSKYVISICRKNYSLRILIVDVTDFLHSI
jgi:hypothetical protein